MKACCRMEQCRCSTKFNAMCYGVEPAYQLQPGVWSRVCCAMLHKYKGATEAKLTNAVMPVTKFSIVSFKA